MPEVSTTPPTTLRETLLSYRGAFVHVGIFSLFINLVMLAPPLYMLQVYDRILASRSHETLLMLTLILGWMFVTLGVLEVVRSRILVRLGSRLDQDLNSRIYRTLMRLTLRDPDKAGHQPLTDLVTVRQFMSGNGTFAFFDTPWIPIYLGILFLFHPMFGWFALFAAVVLMALALTNELSTRRLQLRANGELAAATRLAGAQMRNAEVLHAMGMEDNLHARWMQKHQASVRAMSAAADRAGVWMNLSKTLRQLFSVADAWAWRLAGDQ